MKKMWVLYTYLLDEVLAHDLVDLRGWLIGGLEDKDGVSLLHHVGRHLPTSGFQTLGGTKTTLQQPTVADILLLIIVLQRNWIQIGIVKNFCCYLNGACCCPEIGLWFCLETGPEVKFGKYFECFKFCFHC